MGGRTPVGQLVFAAVSFWTAAWWAVHQAAGAGDGRWRGTFAFLPMTMGIGLVLLQFIPLPASFLGALSPKIYEVLPLWNPAGDGEATLGVWQTLSLTPGVTRQSFVLLLAGILLFAVTVQRVKKIADVERIVRSMAISVSVMAAFGVVQFLTSNGKFFWFYEHHYTDTSACVKGAFTNRNHFAHFIALGIGALLWWVVCGGQAKSRRSSNSQTFGRSSRSGSLETMLKALFVPLCILAALMSFSRGGVLALLAGLATALFLLWRAGRMSGKSFALLAVAGLFVCVGLSIYGYDALSDRFDSTKSLASLSGRSRIWAAASDGLSDHPAVGTGLSSHRFVYPLYLEPTTEDDSLEYTHAENGYVQIALETGLLGLGLALTALVFYFTWCSSTLRRALDPRVLLCFVAILPPLVANAVHSVIDYVWYVPGCMGVIAILGACACRLYQLEREQRESIARGWQLPRLAWAGGAILLVVTAAALLPGLWYAFKADLPWNRYLLLRGSLARLDRDPSYEDIWARSEPRKQILVAIEKELSAVLSARPNWALAHARKAGVHLGLFNEYQLTAENSFDLRQLRETVLTGGFDSTDAAKEWLSRAVGEHRWHLDVALQHAHHAVRLCPLQGDAYILLAQLSFLEGPSAPTKTAYIDQAYQVRPHDGAVLFAIGEEAGLANRPEAALAFWKHSFRRGEQHQQRLIEVLAGHLPAHAFLQEFQPDADATALMVRHYERPELAAELEIVRTAHAAACQAKAESLEGARAAKYWLRAGGTYGELDNIVKQRACFERAVVADNNGFACRLALGICCMTQEDYRVAEEQFRWCSYRKPDNRQVQRLLEQAVQMRIASAGHSERVEKAELPLGRARR
jgi:O-antigen ligase